MGSSETPADSLIGQTVDRKYKILESIESSDLGAVYKATHVITNRTLALKIVYPPSSKDTLDVEFLKNFQQAAKRISALGHPGAVSVEDYGIVGSHGYLVMPFPNGMTLTAVLSRQPVQALSGALKIIHRVASAVEVFHEHDVLHGDLKPDNIIVDHGKDISESAQVANFGISEILSGGRDSAMSKSGRILGSPEYMSPEQVQGEEVDVRSDVYSLGIILYQMIAGEVPFHAEKVMDLLMKHVTDPPPAFGDSIPERSIPQEVEALVMRSLAKDPQDRFQSVRDLREELERLLEDPAIATDEETEDFPPVSFEKPETNEEAGEETEEEEAPPELFASESFPEEEFGQPKRSSKLLPLVTLLALFAVCGTSAYFFIPLLQDEELSTETGSEDTLLAQIETDPDAASPDPSEYLENDSEPISTDETGQTEVLPTDNDFAMTEDPGDDVLTQESEPGGEEAVGDAQNVEDTTGEDTLIEENTIPEEVSDPVLTPEPILEPSPITEENTPQIEEETPPLPLSTPAPTQENKQTAKSSETTLAKGYYVQITAKEDRSVADAIHSKLLALEFPALIQQATVNNILYNRVVIGPHEKLPEAKATKTKVLKEPFIEDKPFIRFVQGE